jgi:two-component system chemotaxis response regulator CheY
MHGRAVDFGSLRILVVENHALMRRILREMLRGFGAGEVHEARSVPQGLDLIYRQDFDAVILDFFLGDMDGADFTRAVRRDASCRNRATPILLITAMPEHHKVLKAIGAGIDSMLAKPIAPRDLYLRLNAMLARPRTFVVSSDYVGPSRRGARSALRYAARPAYKPMPAPERRRPARGIVAGRGAVGMDEMLFV